MTDIARLSVTHGFGDHSSISASPLFSDHQAATHSLICFNRILRFHYFFLHNKPKPKPKPKHKSMASSPTDVLETAAASELETLRCLPLHHGKEFPTACRALLFSIPGNSRCADCCSARPEWASVTYGILLCVQCSGRHRSYGVRKSYVRSVTMDEWSHSQILSMLEGGNEQVNEFFDRHNMGRQSQNATAMIGRRYLTKAALFYSANLKKHVDRVSGAGKYQGRNSARRSRRQESPSSSPSSTTPTADQTSMERSLSPVAVAAPCC